MTIVLNEHEWAADKIASRTLGNKPFETLSRVARYYIDEGHNKKDVRNLLDSFLIQCDPTASLPKWSETLDYALSRALKCPSVDIGYIEISDAEMKLVDSLDGKQVRRLAFTLLCLAKYSNVVNPQSDVESAGCWVNLRDSEIMRMANIRTSVKRQSLMYHNLGEAGLVGFSKKVDNTSVRVCFITPGETVMRVSDFRNLGYQYLKFHGEPYFECQNCGVTEKIKDPVKGCKMKYCKECAVEVATKQRVNSVMRRGAVKTEGIS